MSAAWVFPEIKDFQMQGRGTAEDNFAQEDRGNVEIMVREVLQNPLDAKAADNSGPVQVRISVHKPGEFDAAYLSKIIGKEYSDRLVASGSDALPKFASASILVIEDFGTTGLEGNWNDQNVDGTSENWNAFWFREGEGAKSAGGNGRAGQGKITYYRAGAARLVFGLTTRKSDSATLLMGRNAFVRAYPYKGTKYQMQSFWCANPSKPLPVTEHTEISEFRKAFCLARTNEPGLSLVIPFPKEIDPNVVVQTVVSEFFYPIASGTLEVTINDTKIGADNVETIADDFFPDEAARKKRSSFTKGYRGFVKNIIETESSEGPSVTLKSDWDKTSTISEAAFPDGALIELRSAVEKGKRIGVRFPVTVKPRKTSAIDTYFDVYLEVPDSLDHAEEAYIRRDLLIGSEVHLAASTFLQKARALTVIRTQDLSAFLADAEEPTHLKWNASRPRLAEDYFNPGVAIRAVRQAAPRLMAIVSNGIILRDTKTLAKYFARPSGEGSSKKTSGPKSGGDKTNPPVAPPPPLRKPFKIQTGTDRLNVVPNGGASPKISELPISCILEVAYEGLDQNPFDCYDPFDFDLADGKAHTISIKNVAISERINNRVKFDIVSPDFCLEVSGFDSNIRLKSRLTFTEKGDGAADSDK